MNDSNMGMDLRRWLYLGLSLLGMYFLMGFFLGMPGVLQVLIVSAQMSHGAEVTVLNALASSFLQIAVALFLLTRGKDVAGALARRLDA